jgi:hypothetical protein
VLLAAVGIAVAHLAVVPAFRAALRQGAVRSGTTLSAPLTAGRP